MNLADVHAHLEMFDSSKISAVVARAEEKGVKAIITNSVDAATNRKSLQLQKQFKIVKAAIGIYPITVAKMATNEIEDELSFIGKNSSSFVAFGEIGLDYQKTEDRKKQQLVFEQQLQLAKKLGKPVIVHSRKAEKEVVEALISSGCRKAILHAFHGSMKIVARAVDSGFCFSIPSNVIRSSHFQKMVETVPMGNLFTETDAPFLGPEKNGYSEPAYVALSVQKIAEIKKIKAEDASSAIYRNYLKLFGND